MGLQGNCKQMATGSCHGRWQAALGGEQHSTVLHTGKCITCMLTVQVHFMNDELGVLHIVQQLVPAKAFPCKQLLITLLLVLLSPLLLSPMVCCCYCCCCWGCRCCFLQVDVTPMKLQMGHGQLLKQVYKLLDISQVRRDCYS